MFPFLDRRKQPLEKLALMVANASDQTLADALGRLGPEEIAFVLKYLPMDRSNLILAGFANDAIKAALTLSKADAAPSDRMIARFTDELSEERSVTERAPVPVLDQSVAGVPFSIRALDLATRVLGGEEQK